VIFSDQLHAKAGEYDLNARAHADRPDPDSQRSALVFAAVAMTLRELALMADAEDEREAA
jgi:hypothetical protein